MNNVLQGTIAILLIVSFIIAVTAGAAIYYESFGAVAPILPLFIVAVDGFLGWLAFAIAVKIFD